MIAGAAAHLRYKKHPNTKGKSRPRPVKSLASTPRQGSLLSLWPDSTSPSTSNGHSTIQNPLLNLRKRSGSVPVLKFTLVGIKCHKKSILGRGMEFKNRSCSSFKRSRLCDFPRSNCRGILGIVERAFEKFEAKEKSLKDVFYRSAFVDSMADCTAERRRHSADGTIASIATLRDHQHFLVSLISQVVQSLEKSPQDIFQHIDKIGCFHGHLKKYGFRAQMWDRLGACLLDGLVVQECLRGFPDACRAWTILIAALIDRLRSAPRHMPTTSVTKPVNETIGQSTIPLLFHRNRTPSSPTNLSEFKPSTNHLSPTKTTTETLERSSSANKPKVSEDKDYNNKQCLKALSCLHFEKMLEISKADEIAPEFCQPAQPILQRFENGSLTTKKKCNSYQNLPEQPSANCPHFQKLIPPSQQQNHMLHPLNCASTTPYSRRSSEMLISATNPTNPYRSPESSQHSTQRRNSELIPKHQTNQLRNNLARLQAEKQQRLQQKQDQQQAQQQQSSYIRNPANGLHKNFSAANCLDFKHNLTNLNNADNCTQRSHSQQRLIENCYNQNQDNNNFQNSKASFFLEQTTIL